MHGDGARPAVRTDARGTTKVSLLVLLDRLLGAGVVISGDLVPGVVDVDVVRIRLRALLASTAAATTGPRFPSGGLPGAMLSRADRGTRK